MAVECRLYNPACNIRAFSRLILDSLFGISSEPICGSGRLARGSLRPVGADTVDTSDVRCELPISKETSRIKLATTAKAAIMMVMSPAVMADPLVFLKDVQVA